MPFYGDFGYMDFRLFIVERAIVGTSQIAADNWGSVQTTERLPSSIRARHIDSPLAGIQHADRQHSDTSKGKL